MFAIYAWGGRWVCRVVEAVVEMVGMDGYLHRYRCMCDTDVV
jgi:hypothetical protein